MCRWSENNHSILIADNAKQFAEKVIYLLKNPEKASELATHGQSYVANSFNWKQTTKTLEKLLLKSTP